MLTFQAIGDGNCLYNAEAILLIQAFRQKELEPLFKNKQRLTQFHQLLKIYQNNGLIEVEDKITQKSVKEGFSQLIARFTKNDKIDWDALQGDMALGLREFVQNAIITDEATKQNVKVELVKALDYAMEIGAAAEGDIEEEAIDAAYFEEMPTIKAKILEILADETIPTIELKKIKLSEWFFEGEAVGFSEYLQGETGIGNPDIHVADIEIKVLSSKLGIVHRSYMRGQVGNEQSAVYYNGFASEEKSRQLAKNAVLFSLEKSEIHWDALFIDTPINQALLQEREDQRKNDELQVYLETHGTYKAHCDSLAMTEQEYCTLYGLTKEQFNNPPPIKAAEKPAEEPAEEPAKEIAQKTKTDDKSENKLATAVAKSTDNINLGLNWLVASMVLGAFSHFLIMPLVAGALVSSAVAAPSALLMLGITAVVSAIGGYFVADNIEKNREKETAKAITGVEGNIISSSIQSAHIEKAPLDLLEKSPSFLVYQNTRAQTAKRAEIAAFEGKPNLPRHKLN